MLSDIAQKQQMLHHHRLQNAHKSRAARHWPRPTACLCCAYRISGAEVYSERSNDCWLDLMKAASLRGEAGNPCLMVMSSNLIKSVVSIAGLLVGKSWDKYKQADEMLKDVLQVHVYIFLGSHVWLSTCMCTNIVS